MYSYLTDPGKLREKNEDAALIIENHKGDILMMVLDGMGGHNKGDLASNNAKDFIAKAFQKKHFHSFNMKSWLKKILKKTNTFLYKLSVDQPKYKGMGTTITLFLIHKKTTYMAYIGDSRAYLIYNNNIKQYSTDETYVQFLFEQGKITKEEMATHPSRNVVTNALGCYDQALINVMKIEDQYDYLLLCSDGLYNMLEDKKMLEIINKYQDDIVKATKRLITRANMAGGKDNISVCLYKKEQL